MTRKTSIIARHIADQDIAYSNVTKESKRISKEQLDSEWYESQKNTHDGFDGELTRPYTEVVFNDEKYQEERKKLFSYQLEQSNKSWNDLFNEICKALWIDKLLAKIEYYRKCIFVTYPKKDHLEKFARNNVPPRVLRESDK